MASESRKFTTMLIAFVLLLITAKAKSDISEAKNVKSLFDSPYYIRPYVISSFNPLEPKVGLFDISNEFDAMVQYKVHTVAFGVRVLKRLLDPLLKDLEYDSASLQERFPNLIMPHDPRVMLHCTKSFLECIDFLSSHFGSLNLTVHHDKVTVNLDKVISKCRKVGNWSLCSKGMALEGNYTQLTKDILSDNPLEITHNYMLLLTSMQFLCWYTMHRVSYLKTMLQCDSSSYAGAADGDERADAKTPFGCAIYSFCPNPCNYPARKSDICSSGGCTGECFFRLEENLNFHHLLERSINVSCKCMAGHVFDPDFQTCIGEYYHKINKNNCNPETEQAFYSPTKVFCQCKFRYYWDPFRRECVFNHMLIDKTKTAPTLLEKTLDQLKELKIKMYNFATPVFQSVFQFLDDIVDLIYNSEYAKRY